MRKEFLLHAALAAFLVLLCSQGVLADGKYFPERCEKVCKDEKDFETPLPATITTPGKYSRPSEWAIVTLNQIKTNLGQLSPPGVGRLLNLVGQCMYEATTLFDEKLMPSAAGDLRKVGTADPEFLNAAIDGAAFRALEYFFGDQKSFDAVIDALKTLNGEDLKSVDGFIDDLTNDGFKILAKIITRVGFKTLTNKLALEVGSLACDAVYEKITRDGFDALGRPVDGKDPTGYKPPNEPQERAGITNCKKEMSDLNLWQPLCTPTVNKALADVGSKDCKVQSWLFPWAGMLSTFALVEGDVTEGDVLIDAVSGRKGVFGGPPFIEEGVEWEKQMLQVLDFSTKLDDIGKLIAEHWADGPDSTTPPGHWWKVAVDAAQDQELDSAETARLLMLVAGALNDAGVAAWRVKFTYDSIRPLQMIQCGLQARGKTSVTAWKGPYKGVGKMPLELWQPYQLDTFKTPPFAGYVSGHSTFSAAAAEALKLFFGSDEYLGAKCRLIEEGTSSFEKKITKGQPGYVKGLTDVPNKGAKSEGYAPATDVTLCWETFTAASDQAGESRLYGGIHVTADDKDGEMLGREIGRAAFYKAQEMFGEPCKKCEKPILLSS